MFILSAPFYNFYLFHVFTHLFHWLPSFNTLSMCLYYIMPYSTFILNSTKHSISNLQHQKCRENAKYTKLNVNLWGSINIKHAHKWKDQAWAPNIYSHLRQNHGQTLLSGWYSQRCATLSWSWYQNGHHHRRWNHCADGEPTNTLRQIVALKVTRY